MIQNRFAIFGCGPSGLVAAHALYLAGAPVSQIDIFSRKVKSTLYGAQYLHSAIPGIDCGERSLLRVKTFGSAQGYLRKVYGESWQGSVSMETLKEDHHAWDIRAAYDDLWRLYSGRIQEFTLDQDTLFRSYAELINTYVLVINTIPRKSLCYDPSHVFNGKTVYAIGDAPDRGIRCPVPCAPNTMVYNGSTEQAWYRVCNIFGHTTAEWPANEDKPKPPLDSLATVTKPLSTNCRCFPGIHHMGRYGEWKKGVLVDGVFNKALAVGERTLKYGSQDALF